MNKETGAGETHSHGSHPSHRIWNNEFECLPVEALRALQLKRLQNTIRHACERVPFYRERLQQANAGAEHLRSLDDLRRIPFTTKENLRDHYPYGLLAVPFDQVVRIHASSGTTGKPTVVPYSRKDLDTWSELVARFLTAGGLTERDVVQISFGYGLFTGGFGLHYGAERIGAAVIPISSGNSERQLQIMRDFGATALVCTPSYALHLCEVAREMGIAVSDLSLRYAFFGGEPWTEQVRQQIQNTFGIIATDNYGLSEVIGPGVSGECLFQNGMHIFEDHFIAEIIDPQSGEPLPVGEQGELVLTTITKEAMPVFRYRTRDICRFMPEPCACGRTFVRMTKVLGRTDDMIIVRGVNVYPSQVETALLEVEGIEPHYQIVLRKRGALDEMEVRVELEESLFTDEMKTLHAFEQKLVAHLYKRLSLTPKVTLVEPKTIERSTGKAKRVLDLRNESH
ncbi:MAG: phenylacetate--CoA ligase family protein [Candidatus Omnitrophota bacterium]|nr:MAG: phenylacetate--CoA ligase family protein [Candidatus Omnitrophota bacterium]